MSLQNASMSPAIISALLAACWSCSSPLSRTVRKPKAVKNVSLSNSAIGNLLDHNCSDYGFVDAGIGQDVFLQHSTLQKEGINGVYEGDLLFCDIAEGSRGKPQVITVYSVQKGGVGDALSVSSDEILEGTIEHYSLEKGYGFVKAQGLFDNVYIYSNVLEVEDASMLLPGTKVLMTVEVGRLGKGCMATSVVLSNEEQEETISVA